MRERVYVRDRVCVKGVCVCVYLISYLKVFPLFFPVFFFTIRRECIGIGGKDGLSRYRKLN